jgi:hypothetical protein
MARSVVIGRARMISFASARCANLGDRAIAANAVSADSESRLLFEDRDNERDHCHDQGSRSYIIADPRRVLAAEGRIVRVARGGVSYANPSRCPHVEPIARRAFLFFGPNMSGEALANHVFAEVVELLHGTSL